ncbi:zinc ribbon domain-containing protein [Micromonospora cathayae]|uniref:Zinc ribbon domain-containing protein n=1 Tax=Micromonospora cathayae TaxID=3028804 RepID=A0ABY7ZX02_9ACTN|nr:zinc ribbon domain-containing protein [Micromonospora sp. HUAS 3]WDZ86921.1 zinc ribbon domain-containing protein [Micromonospora sp. HUAS 3]
MSGFQCVNCGHQIKPARRCPHCGAEQPQWAAHAAKVERSIAEMKAREAEISREQRQLAQKMQAALFQRDIFAHERLKQATRARKIRLRRPGRRAATATATTAPASGAPPRVPRQGNPPPDGPPAPPTTTATWLDVDNPEHPPEASSREVQNIPLGLGALLIGVAAVVFAAVATSSMDALARLLILLAATALALLTPPVVARRGLLSTAETIAAVGLILVPLDGYALHAVGLPGSGAVSGTVFAGLVFAVTAGVAYGYARWTGLRVPRFAAVLAVQPVLPLLAYDLVGGAAGWALVGTGVAALDLWLVRSPLTTERPAGPTAPERDRAATGRPEGAPEETGEVLTEPATTSDTGRPDRPAAVPVAPARPVPWLTELLLVLYGAAVALALAYATTALLRAATVPAALGSAAVLLLAAAVTLVGTVAMRRPPLPDLGAGIATLAVIGAFGRVAAVALPGRALLVVSVVIALTSVAVRAVPERARRGPQLASAVALTVTGLLVAFGALRAGVAAVRAALPAWAADLDAYPAVLAEAAGPAGWQLALSALLLTVAAVLALPAEIRREFAVAGAAVTALAVPASFGLGWAGAPWPMVLTAIGIGLVGLSARTGRAALAHALAAAVVGLVGAGAALARPASTAAVLLALFVGGVLVVLAPKVRVGSAAAADTLTAWAAGGAAFALPGAVAAFVAALVPAGPVLTPAAQREITVPVLAASFLAVCVTVGYAAIVQVSRREISMPLAVGAGLGALVVAAATFAAPGATSADAWVAALLLVTALLLFAAPSIDARNRTDLALDGSDFAAAAATVALVATLLRIAAVLVPGAQLLVAAALVLVVAVFARAMPDEWRRGPVLGMALAGIVIGTLAGWMALRGGFGVIAVPGPIWAGDLTGWPAAPVGGSTAQAPVALVLLGVAAAILLPDPWKHDVSGAAVVLATIGAPAAFDLPWWSPVLVGATVATVFGMAAVAATDPRAGLSRITVAGLVALHGVGAGLVRPWTTALALGIVVLLGVVVAVLARTFAGTDSEQVETEGMPPHLVTIGGIATGAALLALPGALAALAAGAGHPAQVLITAALAASSLGLAAVAALRRRVPQYLPYASLGIAAGASVSALASIPTHLTVGVFAAAAALLGVLAELVRGATVPPMADAAPVGRWTMLLDGALRRMPDRFTDRRWRVSPAAGALAAAALPTVLAVASLAPALVVALVEPYATLSRVWGGPPPELFTPPAGAVDPVHVLTAVLLTVTAALAAVAFSDGVYFRAVPVVLPGLAVTVLIAPTALGYGWPHSTLAALAVFTLAMLGLALTPPPPETERARSLRWTRVLAFGIGLAAGSAGLAGALATRDLTVLTLAGAVAVGVVAALFGSTERARILGWLFASLTAQLLVLTIGLVAGLAPVWSAFGVLAVGAALQVFAARLPRLRRPEAHREAATVEWSGYAAALIALALAFDSPRHVAALLAGWGAVLGVAATRPGRRPTERRILFWSVVACEIVAWWILMRVADVALPEAYTLPFAALALLVGVLELRERPDLSSWVAYGPALVTAFVPTLAIVLATDSSMIRQVLLLLGAVAVLVWGSMTQQQAPVIVGAVVTGIAALHALFSLGPWLVLLLVGVVLLALGANNERRRRAQDRLQTALRGMR